MEGGINISDDDDDDEILIIDNPNPKPPPPVVILFDSDDDDEDNNSNNNNKKNRNEKEKNSNQLNQTKCDETVMLSSDDSDSHCIGVNETLVNEKTNQMKDWYETFKNKNLTRMRNSIYTCPECRAGFPSIHMIDRHLYSRHPRSLHRFKKPNQNDLPIILDSSDSECTPTDRLQNLTSSLQSIQNSIQKSLMEKDKQMMSSLKLNPLPVNSRKSLHPQSERTSNLSAQKYYSKIIHNLPVSSNTSLLHPPSSQNIQFASTRNSNPVVTQLTSTVSQSTSVIVPTVPHVSTSTTTTTQTTTSVLPNTSVSFPPLPRIRNNAQSITSTTTAQSTSSLKTTSSKNNPMTIVIYSPNHEQAQSRMVQINPTSNDLTTSTAIDSNVTSKRKRDSLQILSDDERDVKAQNPNKRLKGGGPKPLKPIQCELCNKRFRELKDKNAHYEVKHTNYKEKDVISSKRKRRQMRRQKEKERNKDLPRRSQPVRKCTIPSSHKPTLSLDRLQAIKPARKVTIPHEPTLNKLQGMKHIVLIDLDNWQKIFESDLQFSPSTFVWCFQGGGGSWTPSPSSIPLRHLQEMKCFYLHPKCGRSKDAADFALCVQAGKLDVLLPKEIPFTVLSGDKGFNELRNQLSLSKREVHIVDPHNKSIDTVLAILNSIADK